MKLNFQWKPYHQNMHCDYGSDLFLNGTKVGETRYDEYYMIHKRVKIPYVGRTIFSGKKLYGYTHDESKHKVEAYVIAWFEEALRGSEVK